MWFVDLMCGYGVDVFFDNVGGDVFVIMLWQMVWGGWILFIGFISGLILVFVVNLLLLKNYVLVGVFWGVWVMCFFEFSVQVDE